MLWPGKSAYENFKKTVDTFKHEVENENISGKIISRRELHKPRNATSELRSEVKTRFIKNTMKASSFLERCVMFDIDEDTKKLCANTKIPKSAEKNVLLPYPVMFFNVNFTNQDFRLKDEEITGILVTKGQLISTNAIEQVGESLNAFILTRATNSRQEQIFLDVITFAHKISEEHKDSTIENQTLPCSKFVSNFVLNVLNLINDPDVKRVPVVRNKKNANRRSRQGKIALPPTEKILITGQLKIYVNKAKTSSDWHYNFKFPVRSHLRRYRDSHGEVVKTAVVKSYVKGQGPLINKTYEVNAKNKRKKEYDKHNLDYDSIKPAKKPLKEMKK